MNTAFENARKGDVEYFTQPEIHNLLPQYIHTTDEDQRTLLHNAVTSGRAELVEYLLLHGAAQNVNSQDEEGWSPLHSAVSCGFEREVELLILNGADVSVQTSAKRTPLHYAASKGHGSILRMLIKNGASVHAKDAVGFTPLHRAAASGKLQAVRILVDEASAALDPEDSYRKTPLVIAVESQNESVVLFLAARGARLDVQLEDGKYIVEVSEKLSRSIKDILEGKVDIDDLVE